MSKNGLGIAGIAVIVIEYILSMLGVEVVDGTVGQFVQAAIFIGSFGLMVWNQLGRRDVIAFFFKQ
jgi:hypothetical protein